MIGHPKNYSTWAEFQIYGGAKFITAVGWVAEKIFYRILISAHVE